MDTSLIYSPEIKQNHLARLIAIIREHCPSVAMIILFGSYARGDWKGAEDLVPEHKSGHPSDYDIPAISEDEVKLSATPRFIYHAIDYVNGNLEWGTTFFPRLLPRSECSITVEYSSWSSSGSCQRRSG